MSGSNKRSAFLHLPPEIRNRIYTFATYPAPGKRCRVAPCMQLILTCKQVHHEYRPICIRADVTINWRDVPHYFQQYFTDKNGDLDNIELSPSRMTIVTNAFQKDDKPVEIDLLPILRLRLAKKEFECDFIASRDEDVKPRTCVHHGAMLHRSNLTTLLKADITTLQKLITHKDESWMEDIAKGRIHKITVSHIGTDCCPQAKFHIGEGENNSVPSEFAGCSKAATNPYPRESRRFHAGDIMAAYKGNFDDYLERVKLKSAFTDNQYSFVSEFEWVYGNVGRVTAAITPCVPKSDANNSVSVA